MLEVRVHVLVQKRLLADIREHEIGCGKRDVLVLAFTNVVAFPGDSRRITIFDLSADLFQVGRIVFHLLEEAAVDAIVVVDNALLRCYLRHVIVGMTGRIFLLMILRVVPSEK